MRISDIKPVSASAATKKKNNSADGGFSDLLSSDEVEQSPATTTPPAGGINTISSLSSLLAIQQVENNDVSQEEYIDHGNNILDHLDQLRLNMLNGEINPNAVRNLLSETQRDLKYQLDPTLKNIIKDIQLRAEVEIAKLERNKY